MRERKKLQIILFNSECDRERCFVFSVDQEFDTVSGFLLKRTKDMVNKYRQLLVREAQVRPRGKKLNELQRHLSGVWADWWCRVCNWGNVNLLPQQESPSAEMVMLERLFLQAERCALAEDRRRVRRDPGERPSRKCKPSASSSSLLHACL